MYVCTYVLLAYWEKRERGLCSLSLSCVCRKVKNSPHRQGGRANKNLRHSPTRTTMGTGLWRALALTKVHPRGTPASQPPGEPPKRLPRARAARHLAPCTRDRPRRTHEHLSSEGGRDDRGVPYHAESTLSGAQVLKHWIGSIDSAHGTGPLDRLAARGPHASKHLRCGKKIPMSYGAGCALANL